MSNKTKKGILILCLCILLLPLAFYVLVHLLFIWSFAYNESYIISAPYGDRFIVSAEQHDFHHMKCTFCSVNSEMVLYFTNKIESENVTGLAHTDNLKVYDVSYTVIFDDGNGFKELTKDNVDDNPKVAEIVLNNIMSRAGWGFFTENMKILLQSKDYRDKAEQIIEYVKQDDYNKLSKYGLTEEIKNNGYTLKMIKQEITYELKNYI